MKKTFTFLFSIILMTSAFAQYGGGQQQGQGRGGDYGYNRPGNGGGNHDNSYFFTSRDRDIQIAQINRDYGYKIQSVQSKFFMGRREKERKIFQLQQQRDDEVRAVWFKYNDRRNRGDDRRDNRGNGHW